MDRTTLINTIKERTGITKYNIAPVVEAMCEIIGDTLVSGEDVKLVGFGKFEVRHRKARHILDLNGNDMNLPASKNIVFKPSIPLRNRLLGR